MGAVREFLTRHYRHFNARELVRAAAAYKEHLARGGKMLLAMAGAMSTAELGLILARLIREEKVHAICCTGANLEEDVFNLVAHQDYRMIDDWRQLSAKDECAIYETKYNRVTDTCIPEAVMVQWERILIEKWKTACEEGTRKFPWEYVYEILRSGRLKEFYQTDPADSWVLAAMEKNLPCYTPGWEDSTCGQIFASAVVTGKVPHHQCVKTGTEQFQDLMDWYLANCNEQDEDGRKNDKPSVGFFQIGGGIAGDFSICVVPSLIEDVRRKETPLWGYFCQISDAIASYGGYSGAVPNEKITWGKLSVETPRFMIQSDATIVAPLIFAYVLND